MRHAVARFFRNGCVRGRELKQHALIPGNSRRQGRRKRRRWNRLLRHRFRFGSRSVLSRMRHKLTHFLVLSAQQRSQGAVQKIHVVIEQHHETKKQEQKIHAENAVRPVLVIVEIGEHRADEGDADARDAATSRNDGVEPRNRQYGRTTNDANRKEKRHGSGCNSIGSTRSKTVAAESNLVRRNKKKHYQ